MAVVSTQIEKETRGDGDTLDITRAVEEAVRRSGLKDGVVTLFAVGSTVGLTTIELEPGSVADFNRALEEIGPRDAEYRHHLRWTACRTIPTS